jgi:hypothetical protein
MCTGRGLRLVAIGIDGRLVLSPRSPNGALLFTTEGRGAGTDVFLDDEDVDRGAVACALIGIREAGYEGGAARVVELEAIGDGRIGVGSGSLIVLTIMGRDERWLRGDEWMGERGGGLLTPMTF